MLEFEETAMVEVEYQATIATGQFENVKPVLKMRCKPSEVEQTMLFLRTRLQKEYKSIKQKKSDNNTSQ